MSDHVETKSTPKHSAGVQMLSLINPQDSKLIWVAVLVDRTKNQVDSVDFLGTQAEAVRRAVSYLTSNYSEDSQKVVYINDQLSVNYSREMVIGFNGFPETHTVIMPDDYFALNTIISCIASQMLVQHSKEHNLDYPIVYDNEKGE